MPILTWFAPPELSRPDLRVRARALWLVSSAFFALVAGLLGIAVLIEPDTLARRTLTIAAVGFLVAVIQMVSRAGRPVLASWVLVMGLSVIVTQRSWITGGIHAPVAVFYALFILMAGVLINFRAAIATALACFLGAIVLTVGTAQGWLATPPGSGSALADLVFVTLAICLATSLALVLAVLSSSASRRDRIGVDAIQMLVHDMRSPLQVMIAHLELLRHDVKAESVEDVEAAIGGAAALNRMTSSLLDVGRLEAGRMPVNHSGTALSALAESVVSAIRILQPARDIAVAARGDTVCSCDPELMRRVVENLVSNAIKHTPVDGRVRVIVYDSAERVTLAVQDEGPGIPLENRGRIFQPYSAEALQSVSGYESSGLGLAFCRLAVEAHGGTIRIEDCAPNGSAFVVELPR